MKEMDTREKILIHACHLVEREGFTRLTMDRVAKEAGLSKGGLLYHFPTKEELEISMIEYVMDRSNTNVENKVDNETPPNKFLRGSVRAVFEEAGLKDLTSSGLLATMISNPKFVDSWRNQYKKLHETMLEESSDPALAYIIFLALDGLWFADLLNLDPPKGELREQLFKALLDLTYKHSLK